MARVGRDADLDPVRQDACAAGDCGSIAAGFANDGRRFPRDRGLVDGRDAVDNFTVRGDELSRPDEDDVVFPQLRSGNDLSRVPQCPA